MDSKVLSKPIRQKLALLEAGEASLEDARALVKVLTERGSVEDVAVRIYEGLRGWVGNSLQNTGTTGQLRDWYALIEAVAAQFDRDLPMWAARIEVLSDLLRDRIARGASQDVADVIQRQHVPQLLEVLSRASMTPMERGRLKDELCLKDANLSRVLRLVRDAGLVDKVCRGKEALFALNRAGLKAWEAVHAEKLRRVPPRFVLVGHRWAEEPQEAAEIASVRQGGGVREFASKIEAPVQPPLAA